MISLLLYGRNDAHGYNLHRRAALSLNCLAEVLTDPGDEIVFVDYNTPDELPTFVEALADTLTERCLDLLRVLRVPAALHLQRFGERTHLPALEPVARNVAARHSNPANRWLLSTNTDMVFLLLADKSLSDVCRDLPDAYYGLPRFEIPEWLWERLPRSDPERAMAELGHLGPRLHLDEPTLNDEWVRFDAPGDFQLLLREDLFAIDGFDEEMLLGWHVDSNLSRRMFLLRGAVESLEDRVAGYHCNHSRTPTVYGAEAVGNDLARFFTSVRQAELPSQRETWGLADADLEEIPIRARAGRRFSEVLASAIPPRTGPGKPSNVLDANFELTYDSGHVLGFIADSIAVSPPGATVGYLGANPVLQAMLARLVEELDAEATFRLIPTADEREMRELAKAVDVFVVDFGLDATLAPGATLDRDVDPGVPRVPPNLRSVMVAFDPLIRIERERLERGRHPKRFVLVNSSTAFVNSFVVSHLDCSHSSMHSRVRRATVKPVPTARVTVLRDLSWSDRFETSGKPLCLRTGETVEIGELRDFTGFGQGWGFPDPTAIWTRGSRADLVLACDDASNGTYDFELSIGRIGVPRGASLDVALLIAGERVAAQSIPGGTHAVAWRVGIPVHAIARPTFDVVLEMDAHGTWADGRKLGLHVRSLRIERGGLQRVPRLAVARAHRAVARLARTRIRIESA